MTVTGKKNSGKNTGKKVPIFLSPKVFGKNVTGKKEFMIPGIFFRSKYGDSHAEKS